MTPEHIIILSLIALLALHSWLTGRERKELYSRLMAGSLRDFWEQTDTSAPPIGGNFIKRGMDRARKEAAGDE